MKRSEMPGGFVTLVEDEFNDVPDENVSMWLSNFIGTEVRLTP
jgi:CRISPR/Cas system CSM-associated protein Csm4 (group 5 of RAMP superfamily)